ncbi:hypothetical protein CXU07_11475 [Akkermansia muciniphila]|nr:hypothetical protein [Akkermansia sp.]PNC59822.1 hypothetical protein CXU07_11475 [Akkermansia muciniphila]QAA38026.1 hypothetical protein C1I90_01400 [Akkermansia muciniphila]
METGGVFLRTRGFPGWGGLLSGNAFHTDSVPPAEISGRLFAQSRKSLSCRDAAAGLEEGCRERFAYSCRGLGVTPSNWLQT